VKQARYKRSHIVLFLSYEIYRIGQFIEMESGLEVTQGMGEGGNYLIATQCSFRGMTMFLNLGTGGGCTTL